MTSLQQELNDSLQEFILTEQELYEMANLHPSDTGLPSEINSIFNGVSTYTQHGPRVKVRTSRGWIPIAVGKTVYLAVNMKFKDEDMKKINAAIDYVKQHKQSFINHWNGKITDKGLMEELFYNKKAKRIKDKPKVGAV